MNLQHLATAIHLRSLSSYIFTLANFENIYIFFGGGLGFQCRIFALVFQYSFDISALGYWHLPAQTYTSSHQLNSLKYLVFSFGQHTGK